MISSSGREGRAASITCTGRNSIPSLAPRRSTRRRQYPNFAGLIRCRIAKDTALPPSTRHRATIARICPSFASLDMLTSSETCEPG